MKWSQYLQVMADRIFRRAAARAYWRRRRMDKEDDNVRDASLG